jgi:hypothetical protein
MNGSNSYTNKLFRDTGTVTEVRSTLQEWYLPKYLHYLVIYYENDKKIVSYKQILKLSGSNFKLEGTTLSEVQVCKIWGFHGSDYEE